MEMRRKRCRCFIELTVYRCNWHDTQYQMVKILNVQKKTDIQSVHKFLTLFEWRRKPNFSMKKKDIVLVWQILALFFDDKHTLELLFKLNFSNYFWECSERKKMNYFLFLFEKKFLKKFCWFFGFFFVFTRDNSEKNANFNEIKKKKLIKIWVRIGLLFTECAYDVVLSTEF